MQQSRDTQSGFSLAGRFACDLCSSNPCLLSRLCEAIPRTRAPAGWRMRGATGTSVRICQTLAAGSGWPAAAGNSCWCPWAAEWRSSLRAACVFSQAPAPPVGSEVHELLCG